MSFRKVRAGRWESLDSPYRIEARGRECFAIILNREIVAQAKTLADAMGEVLRREVAG